MHKLIVIVHFQTGEKKNQFECFCFVFTEIGRGTGKKKKKKVKNNTNQSSIFAAFQSVTKCHLSHHKSCLACCTDSLHFLCTVMAVLEVSNLCDMFLCACTCFIPSSPPYPLWRFVGQKYAVK